MLSMKRSPVRGPGATILLGNPSAGHFRKAPPRHAKLVFYAKGAKQIVNWGWLLLRIAVAVSLLSLLIASQRFWYRAVWRFTGKLRSVPLRFAIRLLYAAALVAIIVSAADGIRMSRARLLPHASSIASLAGLWFLSALFAYLAVKAIHALDRAWSRLRAAGRHRLAPQPPARSAVAWGVSPSFELLPNPSRRYFFQTATALAGATPFFGAVYGFAAERLK